MPKICKNEGCGYPVWGAGYCRIHQYLRPGFKEARINTYSQKRQEINKLYYARAKIYVKNHPRCIINSPVCTKATECVNHIRGRGIYLLDEGTWEASCRACNSYIEVHDQWARNHGHKKSRLGQF